MLHQTIVEALRYATTGEQPPGAKGGFVHDPKVTCRTHGTVAHANVSLQLADEKSVDARIKLKFFSTNRKSMTTTRQMLATRTAGKANPTMKAIESSLSMIGDNDEVARRAAIVKILRLIVLPQLIQVSRRCTDMDKLVRLLVAITDEYDEKPTL